MRVGVIGTGFGARVVAPVFADTPGCTVVDVVSARDEHAVERLCRRDDLDLVGVHSPPFRHAAHVSLALARGHDVLCDKPFGLGAVEAGSLLEQAGAAGVLHFVNFEFRHHPARVRLRELVTAGAIGTPEQVVWTHVSSATRHPLRRHGWLFDPELGGGWIGAWGAHAVDAIRWIFGDIVRAEGLRRVTVPRRPDDGGAWREVDAEDGFCAVLGTADGLTCTLDSTSAAGASVASRIVVSGSEGVLECVGDGRITLRRADGGREEVDVPATDGDPHLVPMRRWAEVVRDAVHGRAQVAPSFDDGLACARVLDRLRHG